MYFANERNLAPQVRAAFHVAQKLRAAWRTQRYAVPMLGVMRRLPTPADKTDIYQIEVPREVLATYTDQQLVQYILKKMKP